MKPPPFAYHAPRQVEEALDLLAEVGADGKVLAGGQSLIPVLNMRLAAPAHLVDINRLPGLSGVEVDATGVSVGALARHADAERDEAAYAALPLLRQTLQLVAHPVIRNRGTVCGSLAHADPAAELPAVLVLLGGTVEVASRDARRTVAAADFFVGPLESALAPEELVLSARFPIPPAGTGTEVVEVSRRHGDYALCGVAATVTVTDGAITAAGVACFAVGPAPLVVDIADTLAGQPAEAAQWHVAAEQVQATVDPDPDIHASADYRRHLAGVLTERALRSAAGRATGQAA